MCCVEYYICSDTGAYSISSSEATSTGGTNCSTDYLIINGGTASCDLSNAFNSENIFCGAIFNAADTGTATGPICGEKSKYQNQTNNVLLNLKKKVAQYFYQKWHITMCIDNRHSSQISLEST